MPNQQKTIEALKAAGLRESVKVMIGGAPTTRAWADEIGADGYAEDAIEAVSCRQGPAGRGLKPTAELYPLVVGQSRRHPVRGAGGAQGAPPAPALDDWARVY